LICSWSLWQHSWGFSWLVLPFLQNLWLLFHVGELLTSPTIATIFMLCVLIYYPYYHLALSSAWYWHKQALCTLEITLTSLHVSTSYTPKQPFQEGSVTHPHLQTKNRGTASSSDLVKFMQVGNDTVRDLNQFTGLYDVIWNNSLMCSLSASWF
jgi:hypothetical protein